MIGGQFCTAHFDDVNPYPEPVVELAEQERELSPGDVESKSVVMMARACSASSTA